MNANDRYINTIQRVLTFEKYEKDFIFGLPIKTVLNKVRTFANHGSFLARLIYTALNAEMYSCMAKREKIVNHNVRKSGVYYRLKEMYVIELSRLFFTHNLEHPEYLILDEPRRGIDVGTKVDIQKLVLRLASGGRSITFISSETDEMLRTCSRLIVMRDRKVVGELTGEDLTQNKIMSTIAGGENE
jgi:ABC-type uncharacterized transport system ATPase subunit